MKNIKSLLFIGLIVLTSIIQSFASVTKSMTLPGGVTATTQTTVLVHKSVSVKAVFKVRRSGSDTDFAERKVLFILTSPNGATIEKIQSIGQQQETVVLELPAAGGTSQVQFWKAEMKNNESAGNPEVSQSVSGSVEFFSNNNAIATIPAPAKFGLSQSGTATKIITMPFTGDLTIQANWDTDELTLNNFQLSFALYKGNTLLKSDSGYSRDSIIIGISDSQRMKISYKVKATDFQIPGDWNVRVTGSSHGKVKNIDLKMQITKALY